MTSRADSSPDALQTVLEAYFAAADRGESPDVGALCGGDTSLESRVRRSLEFEDGAARLLATLGPCDADDSPPLNPLGDLFKTQVWALARHVGVPEVILAKPATAEDEHAMMRWLEEMDKRLERRIPDRQQRRGEQRRKQR